MHENFLFVIQLFESLIFRILCCRLRATFEKVGKADPITSRKPELS